MKSRLGCALVTFVLVASSGCGATSRRDLTAVPQRQITFDDMCRLQTYFDQRNATRARLTFRSTDEQSNETAETEPDENGRMHRAMIGEGTYLVSDRAARRQLRDLLDAEYDRVPPIDLTSRGVAVQVHASWWASGQMRRLRPDQPVVISNGSQRIELPFNPCIGEFLFGAPIYALRRSFLDAETARAHGEIPSAPPAAMPADVGAATIANDPSNAPLASPSPSP